MKQKSTLEFDDLPKPIRSWLASNRTTNTLVNLNNRLNISGQQRTILPELIYQIATLSLDPRDLVSQIALQLNLSDTSSKIIAQELEKNIFHEIEDVLREELGLDIAQLHFGRDLGPLPKVESQFQPTQNLPSKTPLILTEKYIESATLKKSQTPKNSEVQPLPSTGPFILHAEKEEVKPTAEKQPTRPTFSIKIPITQKKYYSTPAPIIAKIETPEIQSKNEEQKNKTLATEEASQNPQIPPTPRNPLPTKPLSEIIKNTESSQTAKISEIPEKIKIPNKEKTVKIAPDMPTTTPQIKKVVHYSNFYTKL